MLESTSLGGFVPTSLVEMYHRDEATVRFGWTVAPLHRLKVPVVSRPDVKSVEVFRRDRPAMHTCSSFQQRTDSISWTTVFVGTPEYVQFQNGDLGGPFEEMSTKMLRFSSESRCYYAFLCAITDESDRFHRSACSPPACWQKHHVFFPSSVRGKNSRIPDVSSSEYKTNLN